MTSTSPAEPGLLRRIGAVGFVAIAGILLLIIGVTLVGVESQVRIDAADAAVYLTAEQLELLSEAGIDDIGQEAYRDWLITGSMTTGGPMPKLELEISDTDDEVMWSWAPSENQIVGTIGGWQPKPLAGVAVAGLALIIGSLFVAASRWRRRHLPA